MKQTAVEWLEDQIKNSKYYFKLMAEINSRSTVSQSNIFEQAKEMEKEQIVEAHGDKQKTKSNPDSIVTYGYWFSGEDYYNKYFKNEK